MATYLYGMLFELKINELFDLFNHYIGRNSYVTKTINIQK